MKTWIKAPSKSQVIVICSITAFIFLRLLVKTNFLTAENFSNRHYIFYGSIMLVGFTVSVIAIILYRLKNNFPAHTKKQ